MLPLELVYLVTENLHADRGTLVSCSLVSRFWNTASRSLLFRVLTVSSKRSPDQFVLFLEFLHNTPSVACLVERLTLAGTARRSEITSPHTNFDPRTLSHPLLFEILQQLPFLRHLCVRSLAFSGVEAWRTAERQKMKSFSSSPTIRIETLHFHSMPDGSGICATRDIDGVLAGIASVQLLHISDFSLWNQKRDWPADMIPLQPRQGPHHLIVDNTFSVYQFSDWCRKKTYLKSISLRYGKFDTPIPNTLQVQLRNGRGSQLSL